MGNVLFLSSSYVNLAKLFATKNPQDDVFLILDRKFPFEIEDLENFYPYIFNNNKQFEKDREKYFDNLTVFIQGFEPDILVTDNFSKILPKSFIQFIKFRNPNTKIINIHSGDLRIEKNGDMLYSGLNGWIRELLDNEEVVTTIHEIEDEKMDSGKQLFHSNPTSLKELKQKGILKRKDEIINLRIRNVILSYHGRTKVLNGLSKVIENETK